MNIARKYLSVLLSVALISMSFTGAQAAIVTNHFVIAQDQDAQQSARTGLLRSLQRDDVSKQLASMGVDTAALANRINMMSDEEIARLNHQFDQLPAGGDVLGVILVIFIVFVITDVIGATDIFPFIKPVN